MKKFFLLLILLILPFLAFSRQPERGYRGFIDSDNFLLANFSFLSGDGGESTFWTGFTTSHGYQFNDWLYVGAGSGMVYNTGWKSRSIDSNRCIVPLFAEVRFDAKWGRFTPFFSAQIGGNFTVKGAEGGGIYASPMIGYRFNWGRKSAINLALGATMYGTKESDYRTYWDPDEGLKNEFKGYRLGERVMFTVRLGYDFQLP